jgi:hypothetical protein
MRVLRRVCWQSSKQRLLPNYPLEAKAPDEMNTLIDVQAGLKKATRGLMYNSWNQEFSAPADELAPNRSMPLEG